MADFYCLLSPQSISSSSAVSGEKKRQTHGPCVILWWDCLNVNPFRLFWWCQEHFVPGAQKIHLSVGVGMHRADERHCLPIVHSKLWWLRGFSCSGPSLTHMALDGSQWKRLGTWICSLEADLRNIFTFSGLLTDQQFLLDAQKWMGGNELQRLEVFTVQNSIWEHGKLEMWGLNICTVPKGFRLFIYLSIINVCKAASLSWMKGMWSWTWGINMNVKAWGAPEQQKRGRREKREEDLAERKDCLSSQLYNVTPIMKKFSTLPAKTNITQQIIDKCDCSG